MSTTTTIRAEGDPGAEGQGWSRQLLQMYILWAKSRGYGTSSIQERNSTTFTVKIEGDHVETLLGAEVGVHRLTRNSPHDEDDQRVSSFTTISVGSKSPKEPGPELQILRSYVFYPDIPLRPRKPVIIDHGGAVLTHEVNRVLGGELDLLRKSDG